MRRIALTVGTLFAAMTLWSCAEAPPAKSKAFVVDTLAPTPYVNVAWSNRIDDIEFFTQLPTQFSRPRHLKGTDELVVATANGEVFKYRAANGEVLWKTKLPNPISAQPGYGKGKLFIADLHGNVHALDANTGKPLWTFTEGSSFETPPTFGEDRVFITDVLDTLISLDAKTGKELWRYARPRPEYFTLQGSGQPSIKDGEVFCGFADGHLLAFQLDGGDIIWDADLTAGKDKFLDVDGELFFVEDRIIASSYSGGVFAVDQLSGEIVWRTEASTVTDLELYEGTLYIGSALGRVESIDAESGEPTWGFKFKDSIPGHVRPYGPYLVVTTEDAVYFLDRGTGHPLRIMRGNSGYSSGVEVGAERLYMFSDLGRIVAFRLAW